MADRQGFMAENIYTTLTPERQFHVLRTMRKGGGFPFEPPAGTQDPFVSVCLAYAAEQHLLEAAKIGRVDHAMVSALEEYVDDVGGALVHGLASQGPNSIAEFRATTFLVLEQSLSSSKQALVLAELNSQLKNEPPLTIDDFFSKTRQFFLSHFDFPPASVNTLSEFNDIQGDFSARTSFSSHACLSTDLTPLNVLDSDFARPCLPSAIASLGLPASDAGVGGSGVLREQSHANQVACGVSAMVNGSVLDACSVALQEISTSLSPDLQPVAKSTLDAFWVHHSPFEQSQVIYLFSDFIRHLSSLEQFFQLSRDRQLRVYETLTRAYSSAAAWVEIRSFCDAFHAVVQILVLEQDVVAAPSGGHPFIEKILDLCKAVGPIASFFSIDSSAASPESIQAFCAGPVHRIRDGYPPELARACFAALNSRLSYLPLTCVGTREMVVFSVDFLEPILRALDLDVKSRPPVEPSLHIVSQPQSLDHVDHPLIGPDPMAQVTQHQAMPRHSQDEFTESLGVAKRRQADAAQFGRATVGTPIPLLLDDSAQGGPLPCGEALVEVFHDGSPAESWLKTEQDLSPERAAQLLRGMRCVDPDRELEDRSTDSGSSNEDGALAAVQVQGHSQHSRIRHNLFLYALLVGTGMIIPQVAQVASRRFLQPTKSLAAVNPVTVNSTQSSPTPPFLLTPERASKAPALPPAPVDDDELELNSVSLSDLPPPIEMPVFVAPQRRPAPTAPLSSSTASAIPLDVIPAVSLGVTPSTAPSVPAIPQSRVSPELPNLPLSLVSKAQVPSSGDAGGTTVRRAPQRAAIHKVYLPPVATNVPGVSLEGQRQSDPYAELPGTLREPLRQQVNDFLVRQPSTRQLRLLKAGNVVLKSPLSTSREYEHIPVVMLNDGQVVLLSSPSNSSLMGAIQAWADAQPLPPEGFATPVLLSFQPRV